MSPDHNAAPTDFDVIKSRWRVAHSRLNARLAGCMDWTTLASTSTTRKVLEGDGNVEDNVLDFPEGPVRALALGSFDPELRRWAVGWHDGRSPHQLDVPVIAGFSENRVQSTVSRHREDRVEPTVARKTSAFLRDERAKTEDVPWLVFRAPHQDTLLCNADARSSDVL